MNLLIVESPAKAKTINKYLGSSYKVVASFGHVRDLPAKDGSVDPDNDFAMLWTQDDERSKKVVREIAEATKNADKLILATDPDREGEAISWHLLEELKRRKAIKKGMPVERVTFNAITKQSVQDALKNPRQIDDPLVSAYLARRALDYLVGFNLSPVLWRKLPGARSAGRVQSVALRILCEREAEIEAFKTDEYWTIDALLETAKKEEFSARLVSIAGQKLEKLSLKEAGTANSIKAAIEKGDFRVVSVDKKPTKRNPYPPFMTSTLQMDASRKLGFSAKQTMGVAQRLYEGIDLGGETVGLITYMRTDGVDITPEGVAAIRKVVQEDYSNRYLPPFIREYKTKAKNAQEAHEAIRPTDPGRRPQDIKRYLEKDQFALYELIWKRTVASQMASAEMEQTTAEIDTKGRDGKHYGLRASGTVVNFEGFLKVYNESRDSRVMTIEKGKDDKLADADDDDDRRLPALASGDRVKDKQVDAEQHFTQPPPRYSEASLVKRLEELGIGRPSTYASTLATLVDREYVRIDKKRLLPEDKGRMVTSFLVAFFKRYVEYDYTAGLEEQLDLISDDKLDWREMLRKFWKEFRANVDETKELRITDVLNALNDSLGPHLFPDKGDGTDPRLCPKCGNGQLSLKPSRQSGAFIGCGNYPECSYSRPISAKGGEGDAAAMDGKVLGIDDATGKEVLLKNGRFGPYVQLGEAESKEDKPKRGSIPKAWDVGSIDLEKALKLLRLPREIGMHPETNTPIVANFGRFGPYILHDGTYVNVASADEVFEVGINRAVTMLAEKRAGKAGGFKRGAAARTVLLDLGEHPDEGGKIEVLEGKYGPYIAHNGVNATVPKARDPKTLTVTEAITLLAERIAKGGGKPAKKGGRFAKKAKAEPKGETSEAKPAAKKKAPAKKVAKGSTKSDTPPWE